MSTTTLSSTSTTPSRGLHVGLWVTQGLLAFAFLGAGSMKLTQPVEALATQMSWVNHVPAAAVPLIGAAEVAGALGLILPSALRIAPKLTPLAAALLTVTMISAGALHVAIGEAAMLAAPVILGALSAFVAWGRGVAAPIAPK